MGPVLIAVAVVTIAVFVVLLLQQLLAREAVHTVAMRRVAAQQRGGGGGVIAGQRLATQQRRDADFLDSDAQQRLGRRHFPAARDGGGRARSRMELLQILLHARQDDLAVQFPRDGNIDGHGRALVVRTGRHRRRR